MKSKKVLIGCPTSDSHAYALESYTQALKSLTYPHHDILLVDNSKGNEYFKKLQSHNLPVIKGPWFESARDRIIASRNLLRQHVLDKNYDYFLSLEQDVIPPQDILEDLLIHKKRLVSAIYFNYVTKGKETRLLPTVWTNIDKKSRYLLQPSQLNKGIMEIALSGLGCVLIHRSILSKVKFRYEKNHPAFDDIYFYLDCKSQGFRVYADTTLICKHLLKNRPWDWKNLKV